MLNIEFGSKKYRIKLGAILNKIVSLHRQLRI